MSNRVEEKTLVRQRYLAARCAMPADVWARASEQIRHNLERQPFYRECGTILTYVSSKDNEADTCGIIDAALASGRRVLAPITDGKGRMLRWARIHARGELIPARFGLLEPDSARTPVVEPPSDALCLVPGIVFTRDGKRIGYGGGYYDRFLASFSGVAVGLAFEMQLAPSVPTSEHDCSVQYIITESHCYPCNNPR